ncbi:MAG: hypothetical protein ABJA90_09645 [Ginsengibacter sp.]
MSQILRQSENNNSTKVILLAGLLVGTLDILSAFVDYYFTTGKNPLLVLNYVASGALGQAALTGGAGTMLLGLLFHYLFALFFTVFFFWLYSRLDFLSRNRIITGIGYGLFVWIIMNLIVVQLCKAPHASIEDMKAEKVLKSAIILIVMIGLPLSFIAKRYSRIQK